MTVILHRSFEKHLRALTTTEQRRFKERILIFAKTPFHPLLGNHPLKGKYQGYRSITIGGDLRAIYKPLESDTAFFVAIGTHSKLYDK